MIQFISTNNLHSLEILLNFFFRKLHFFLPRPENMTMRLTPTQQLIDDAIQCSLDFILVS